MPVGSAGVPPSDRTRVVIADDDRFFAEMLRTTLSRHDAFDIVAVAADGAEAVARVEDLKPSLVVMDVTMPRLDGIEATRRMRALDDPPIVVLITGEEGEETDRRAYDAGAAAYLRKSHELASVIDVVIAVSRMASSRP